MRHLSTLARFCANESGSTAIEYGLIAGLMAIAAIAGITLFGTSLAGVFGFVSDNVGNAAAG